MNKDQVKGEVKNIGGKIKEATGEIVGDFDLVEEGKDDQMQGKIQRDYGNIKDKLKNESN